MSITYSECVPVALGISMQCASAVNIISGLSGCTLFFTLSHKWHDFRNKILDIKSVFCFSLQLLSETVLVFIIRRRIQRYVIKNVYWHSC